MPPGGAVRADSVTEVSVSDQTSVNESSSRDQHEGTTAERTKQIEGDKKKVESGDIPEARRYPVREMKVREHFGEVVS